MTFTKGEINQAIKNVERFENASTNDDPQDRHTAFIIRQTLQYINGKPCNDRVKNLIEKGLLH